MTRAPTAAAEHGAQPDPLVLAAFLPFRLTLAAQSVSQLIATTCEERFGFTIPAWRVMCLLAEEGLLDIRDLALRAVLTESEVDAAAAGLVARGLALRTSLSGLTITPAGRVTHAELAELALAAEAALLAGLSPEEVRSLHRLLGRVQAAAMKLSGRAER